jgi:hypothetical protein
MSHHFYYYFCHPTRHDLRVGYSEVVPRDGEVSLLSFAKEVKRDCLAFENSCHSHYCPKSLRCLSRYVKASLA